MAKRRYATEKQIGFLSIRGCPQDKAAKLSIEGAWFLIGEIKQEEGAPPKPAFRAPSVQRHNGEVGHLRYDCAGRFNHIHDAIQEYRARTLDFTVTVV